MTLTSRSFEFSGLDLRVLVSRPPSRHVRMLKHFKKRNRADMLPSRVLKFCAKVLTLHMVLNGSVDYVDTSMASSLYHH